MKEIQRCDRVYYETYTSPIISQDGIRALSTALGERFSIVGREFIEDGRRILELSSRGNVALLCSGDPLVATTHQELRTRALSRGIGVRVIHGSSVLCAVGGEFGLHSYNFGRVVTMTEGALQLTAYNTIFQNLLRGLHTTLLLQWDESKNFFLSPHEAVGKLLDAERDIKYGVVTPKTLVLVASRLGTQNSTLIATTVESISARAGEPDGGTGTPPHVLVIPGRLHFTEREALSTITGRDEAWFNDNSENVERISRNMVERYSSRTLAALARARSSLKTPGTIEGKLNVKKLDDVFENVECYTQDALRFLGEGRDELAVLSIGYAEGLLDSLRFAGLLEFEW